MTTKRLIMTGFLKRFSGGNFNSLRSALDISFRNGLPVGSISLFFGGADGILSRNGTIGVGDLAVVDAAPMGAALVARYLAPRKPQLGQSL